MGRLFDDDWLSSVSPSARKLEVFADPSVKAYVVYVDWSDIL